MAQRKILIAVLLALIILIAMEFIEFPMITIQSTDDQQTISIVYSKESANERRERLEHKDWFNASRWPKNYCPYYENICVYNQRFYVSKKEDEFHLPDVPASQLFGANMPNIKETQPIYEKILNATTWNADEKEYEKAQCRYDSVTNHMIVQGHYQTMLGEWYSRTLSELYYLHVHMNGTYTINQDVKLYLFLEDMIPLFTSHHLFIQPYSEYLIQHFTNLIERIECNCFKRLFFCGFQRNVNATTGDITLKPLAYMTVDKQNYRSSLRTGRVIKYYPQIIEFYNNYINQKDIHILRDTKLWKLNKLQTFFNTTHDFNVDEWFFIGFYQRTVRRSWELLEKQILPACNRKYGIIFIFIIL